MRYRTNAGENAPAGAEYARDERALVTLSYLDGSWRGACAWTKSERFVETYAEDPARRNFRWVNDSGEERVTFPPLTGPIDTRIGAEVRLDAITICHRGPLGHGNLTVRERTAHTAPRQPDGSDTWHASWTPPWPAEAYAYWDVATGLVVAWRDQGHYSFSDGWIEDTDAPLS